MTEAVTSCMKPGYRDRSALEVEVKKDPQKGGGGVSVNIPVQIEVSPPVLCVIYRRVLGRILAKHPLIECYTSLLA